MAGIATVAVGTIATVGALGSAYIDAQKAAFDFTRQVVDNVNELNDLSFPVTIVRLIPRRAADSLARLAPEARSANRRGKRPINADAACADCPDPSNAVITA